jgi:flagellar motor protein MotB
MSGGRRALGLLATASLIAGCASAPHATTRMADVDRARESPAAQEAKALAPDAFARAETERAEAQKASAAGDDVAASIDADRAVAAYEHAFVLARLARATQRLDEGKSSLAQASQRLHELAASRAQVDAEGEQLEKQLTVAREATPLTASGPTDAKRDAARLTAARALLVEARLLCGAARLVGVSGGGGANGREPLDPEKELATIEAGIATKPSPAPIDAAARVRAKCLSALTLARRMTEPGAVDGDALLAELSASGGLDPSRDERGVVVTLRDAFTGTAVAPAAQTKLADLGRVAAAHPDVGVQVVLHDATNPTKADEANDRARADAAAQALVAGGAKADRVQTQLAGTRAPVVDPMDLAHRARNARVEIVFVTK